MQNRKLEEADFAGAQDARSWLLVSDPFAAVPAFLAQLGDPAYGGRRRNGVELRCCRRPTKNSREFEI